VSEENMGRVQKFNRGRWEVTRERFRIPEMAPPAPDRSVHIGTVVSAVMKSLGLDDRLWQRELDAEWPELVGKMVATHARPGSIEGNRLIVFVDNSVWLAELSRYRRTELLKVLQRRFGQKISDVILRLDPEPPAKARPG
jgi:predicted nucleic acid-binding Zn ribbon protein